MINDQLANCLKNRMGSYKPILEYLERQSILQNMGPVCSLESFDLGSDYIITHREEIANKIEHLEQGGVGTLLVVLNCILDKQGMKQLTSYQLSVYLQHLQAFILTGQIGVEKIINADCTVMAIITIIKTLLTNIPHYLEIEVEQDGYDQFYMNMEVEAAYCNAESDDSSIMQSTLCVIKMARQREISPSSEFLSARETCTFSTEDAQKSKDIREQKMEKAKQQQVSDQKIEQGQSSLSKSRGIQVIEEHRD